MSDDIVAQPDEELLDIYKIHGLQADDYMAWRSLWLKSVEGEELTLDDDAIDDAWAHIMRFSDVDSSGMCGLAAHLPSGQLVGILHFVLHPVAGSINPVCYLQDMYVHPDYRRMGYGNALLMYLKEKASDLGWERIYWFVSKTDEGAQAFYGGQGIEVPFAVHMHPTRMLKEMDLNENN